MKQWRRRYFKLVQNRLYFSKGPTEFPHGVIDLKDCLTVKSAEEKTGKMHAFEVATPDQVYFLHADTDVDKDDWIGKIGKAIVDHSRSALVARQAAEEDDDDDDDDEA